jgi:hypothetical protein
MPKVEYVLSIGTVLKISLDSFIVSAIFIAIIIAVSRLNYFFMKKRYKQKLFGNQVMVIGFFHPFCDAGAGGEKVLFQSI